MPDTPRAGAALLVTALALLLSGCGQGEAEFGGNLPQMDPSRDTARIPVVPSQFPSELPSGANDLKGAEPGGTVGPEGESGASPSPGDAVPSGDSDQNR